MPRCLTRAVRTSWWTFQKTAGALTGEVHGLHRVGIGKPLSRYKSSVQLKPASKYTRNRDTSSAAAWDSVPSLLSIKLRLTFIVTEGYVISYCRHLYDSFIDITVHVAHESSVGGSGERLR